MINLIILIRNVDLNILLIQQEFKTVYQNEEINKILIKQNFISGALVILMKRKCYENKISFKE
jgi:uncharacterized protein YqgQ